jgi:CubicO group peptidase (beta-lactamase class C family)
MDLDAEIGDWPVGSAAVAVVGPSAVLDRAGPGDSYRWASITKLVSALTVLDAVRRGEVSLDEPAGPPGSTVRHLLGHASGLAFDSATVLTPPGRRRIYSNTGIEQAAQHVEERIGEPFADRMRSAVLEPLGINDTILDGSPASALFGPLDDLVRLTVELLTPSVVPPETLALATTVSFPGLPGLLPGFGRQKTLDWGLGFEIKDAKSPHWTATASSPATYGHFGGAGGFLWVDPVARLACCSLSDTDFGDWAVTAWPRFNDRVLAAYSAHSAHSP